MRISRINAVSTLTATNKPKSAKQNQRHNSPVAVTNPSFKGLGNSLGLGVLGGVIGFAVAGPAGGLFGAGLGTGVGAKTEDYSHDDSDIYDYDTYKTTGMTMQDYII